MTFAFRSSFTTTAATVIELSDPLGRLTTEDLEELFATNAPSESITRGVSRPSARFDTPRRSGSGFTTTRMFDMSKFDGTPPSPRAATTTDTKSSGLFGPSPSSITSTQDTQQQQQQHRGFSFSVPPNSVASNSSAGAPDQGTAFVFQSGGTVKPMFGAATSMLDGAFQSAVLADDSKSAIQPRAEFGTGLPPYEPYMARDATPHPRGDLVTFHTICAMPAYAHKSPDELRLEDYIKKEKGIPVPTRLKSTFESFPCADVPRNPFARHTATPSTTGSSGVFSFVSSPVPRTQANISTFSPSSLFGSFSASNASGDFGSTTAGAAAANQGFGVTSGAAFGFSPEPNVRASLFGQATTPSALPTVTSPRFGEAQESGSSGFSFGGSGSGGFGFGNPRHDSSASSFSFGQSSSPGISFGSQSQTSKASGSLFGQSSSSGFSFGDSSSSSFGQSQGSSTPGSLFGQPSGIGFGFGQVSEASNTPPMFGSAQNGSRNSGFRFGQSSSPGSSFGFGSQAQDSGTPGFSFGGSTGSSQGSSSSGSLFGQSSDSGDFSFGGQQQPEATTSLFASASGFGFGSTGTSETTALSFGSATTNAGDCGSDDRNVQQQPTGFKFGSETGNALARDSIGTGGSGGGGDAGSWSFGYSASFSPSSSSSSSDNRDNSSDSGSVSVFNQPAAASDSETKSAGSDANSSSSPNSLLRTTQGQEVEEDAERVSTAP